jgi:hypothetical protein
VLLEATTKMSPQLGSLLSHCSVNSIDYRRDDGRFWSPARDRSSSNPNFSNVEVDQQILIFEISKSRITNVSMLEVMHHEQTNSKVAWKIEIHNSYFTNSEE